MNEEFRKPGLYGTSSASQNGYAGGYAQYAFSGSPSALVYRGDAYYFNAKYKPKNVYSPYYHTDKFKDCGYYGFGRGSFVTAC